MRKTCIENYKFMLKVENLLMIKLKKKKVINIFLNS